MSYSERSEVKLCDLVDSAGIDELRANIKKNMTEDENNHYYFGLQPYSEASGFARFGDVVGVGRLPEALGKSLVVTSRTFGRMGFQVDHVRLYEICAADPFVSQYLDASLTIYPHEEPVEVEHAPDWSRLIALAYLRALRDLTQRHMRQGFVLREEDLHGRVRGQIRIGRYISRSLTRSHPEIVPCRFQELQKDTLENRILRTALVAARRLLAGGKNGDLWSLWARSADTELAGAAITRITPRNFHEARRSGSYRHYAKPLDLAKAVLTRAGFNPDKPLSEPKARLIPFRLRTYELFERYVEVCLRRCKEWKIWAGYSTKTLKGTDFALRPDFLASKGDTGIILDAKYKDFERQLPGGADSENGLRSDVYQVLAYTRHIEAKKEMNEDPKKSPKSAILIYPGGPTAKLGVAKDSATVGTKLLEELYENANSLANNRSPDRRLDICSKSYYAFDIELVTCCIPVPVKRPLS